MYTKNRDLKQLGVMIYAVLIITIAFAAQASAGDDEPEIGFDAPDWVIDSFAVNTKINNIETDDIKGMHGQFDISFDPDVIKVTEVGPCNSNVEIIKSDLENSDEGEISVEFSVSTTNANRVLVEVEFDIVGDEGESCDLGISGSIYHRDGDEISAKWTGDTINIGSFDVSVDAPIDVSADTFDVDIRITNVEDLNAGGFVLSFDSSVVNVTDVEPGTISGKTIPIEYWGFEGDNTIKTIVKLPLDDNGVSGSGPLATITFDVIGRDGDSSVLDIVENSDACFTNTESDKLPIKWIDATVTIDSTASLPPNETDATVFVKNLDDDKLTVFLYIDGNYIDDKDISSGSNKEYSTYKLLEGPHTFKIKWYDHDTKKEHEKVEERSVSGDTDVVVLYTVEHADKDTRISARVYVKNNDDDPLDVFLYVDDTYKEYETIEADDTCDYEDAGYEFDEVESHTFMIRWRDPDTDVEYEKLIRKYIKSEESITLHVDPHTEDDLVTTASVLTSSSAPQSSAAPSSSSSSAPATSAGSGGVESSPTTTSTTPITVLHTDPVSAGGNESGAGQSQSQYHHLYTLVGVIAIITAVMQIKRD
ncbi:MAG: cohesin domain-containing protein [Euryarchaeota archaeon]|nr:cohesin domain-containing protein [Euryarchaeota archaeon]